MMTAQTIDGGVRSRGMAVRNMPGWRSYAAMLAVVPTIAAGAAEAKSNTIRFNFAYWDAARSALGRWAALDPQGRGTLPPAASVAAARAFVRRAEAARVAAAEPYTDEDGEIGFRWPAAHGLASVSFMPDGNVVAYVFDEASGKPPLEIDAPFSEAAFCPTLLERIRAAV